MSFSYFRHNHSIESCGHNSYSKWSLTESSEQKTRMMLIVAKFIKNFYRIFLLFKGTLFNDLYFLA